MPLKEPIPPPTDSTTHCDTCDHLNRVFEAMLEYHAIARAHYEEALRLSNTREASALEEELANSSEPIQRAAKDLREHEASHARASVRTRDRLLRLVKAKAPDNGGHFPPIGSERVKISWNKLRY